MLECCKSFCKNASHLAHAKEFNMTEIGIDIKKQWAGGIGDVSSIDY
jgi:hypothetical protein